MANTSNKRLVAILIAIGVLLLVSVAIVVCLGAGFLFYRNQTQAQPQQVTVEVTREVILTPTRPAQTATRAPAPTQPPVPTAVPPTAAPTPNVVYGNLSLMLDARIASGADPQTIPASPPVPDGPTWDINPQYIEINLTGYALPDTFHKPVISVYPVAAFEQMSDPAREIIAATRQLLIDRPVQVDQIHTLPIWNAGQVFHARLHYLDFKNGSGVAFLSEYAQYFAPINNHDLFYNFQGITADGQYYIVATLPASHPNLIPNADISQADWQKLADDYPGYLNTIIPMLESQPPDSFTPGLDNLDALIQSIKIQ